MGLLRPLRVLYVQVLIGVALGLLVGALWPQFGAALKPLGDALHQADQDGRRAGDLLHRGRRHRAHGRPEGVRAAGRADADLFRGGLDLGAGAGPGGRASWSTRARASTSTPRRSIRRSAPATPPRPRTARALVDYLLNLIPDTFVGAFAERRPAAGAGDRHPDRLRLHAAGRVRRARPPACSTTSARLFFGIIGIDRAAGAHRRLRGHGLHHRQVRPGARWSSWARWSATFYADLAALRAGGAGRDRGAGRLLDPAVPRLHPRGAADRAGRLVVGGGAAADHGRSCSGWAPARRRSGW